MTSDLVKGSFGDLSVIEPRPIFQEIAAYGISGEVSQDNNGGTGAQTSTSDQNFVVESGTDSTGQAYIRSKRPLNYRSGQGMLARFTALFTDGVAQSTQWSGIMTGENAVCIGYKGTEFGILHRYGGVPEIQTLTVSGGASGSEDATITIDGTAYTVSLTSGTVQHNANEIAISLNSQVYKWSFAAIGDTVVSVSELGQDHSGNFAFSSSTATGSWAETQAGVAPTETFYDKSQWSEGQAGAFINPTQGNVYQIRTQYLGYGAIFVYAEKPETGEFVLVHRVSYANQNTRPLFSNPSFYIGWESTNTGNTTNLTIKGASLAGFIEGSPQISRESLSLGNTVSCSTTFLPIVSIRSGSEFNSQANQVITYPNIVSVGSDSTKVSRVQVIKNPTLTAPVWAQVSDGVTPILKDTSATGYTGGTVIDEFQIPAGGSAKIDLQEYNQKLSNGDIITVVARVVSGSASDITAAINWQDDY